VIILQFRQYKAFRLKYHFEEDITCELKVVRFVKSNAYRIDLVRSTHKKSGQLYFNSCPLLKLSD